MSETKPCRNSRLLRTIAAATSLYLLWPAVELVHAGLSGGGGLYALWLGTTFAAGTLVLAGTAITGSSTAKPGRIQLVLGSGIATAVGWGGLKLGITLFPDSNLLGGLGIIFGPIYWLGTIGLFIGVIMVIVERIWRWFHRPVGT